MEKLPVITIAGVPNTGKSTLFNRLTGKRRALVHSLPGMTRDIFRELYSLNNRFIYLQDSGGFFPDEKQISHEINKRVLKSAKDSDIVIFLFDGRRELMGYEKELFLNIKSACQKVIPVINKADVPEKCHLSGDYYSLKEDFIFISAEHNVNIDLLESKIYEDLKEYFSKNEKNELEKPVMRLSFMGKPNVGKSSLINRILNDEKAVVSSIPGTTRDSVDSLVRYHGKQFIITDNAGVRKMQKISESTESAAVIRAVKALSETDIIIFVLDISGKIDQNDYLLAKKIIKAAKPVIIACNKWDLVRDKQKGDEIKKNIFYRFNDLFFATHILTSAKEGKNVNELISRSMKIYEKQNKKIKTSELITIINKILGEKKFLTISGKIFKTKFITIESYKPFFVKLFSSDGARLKITDEKYLKKRITDILELEGIPVFIKIVKK